MGTLRPFDGHLQPQMRLSNIWMRRVVAATKVARSRVRGLQSLTFLPAQVELVAG